jgi:hypothetical protein
LAAYTFETLCSFSRQWLAPPPQITRRSPESQAAETLG